MGRARDETIEERIDMEIIVDAYNSEEQAMGWYYYLQDTLDFPFLAKVSTKRKTLPLTVGQTVEVVAMADEEDCLHEMFVKISYENDTLSIPLAQLEPLETNEATQQAVADWHYWMERGYELG